MESAKSVCFAFVYGLFLLYISCEDLSGKHDPSTLSCASCIVHNGTELVVTGTCPYPELFSTETGSCRPFSDVDCGNRIEPVSPCAYPNTSCSWLEKPKRLCSCPWANLNFDVCKGRTNGPYPWAARKWTPYFIECKQNRTIPSKCNGTSTIFNFIQMNCQALHNVVNEAYKLTLVQEIPTSFLYMVEESLIIQPTKSDIFETKDYLNIAQTVNLFSYKTQNFDTEYLSIPYKHYLNASKNNGTIKHGGNEASTLDERGSNEMIESTVPDSSSVSISIDRSTPIQFHSSSLPGDYITHLHGSMTDASEVSINNVHFSTYTAPDIILHPNVLTMPSESHDVSPVNKTFTLLTDKRVNDISPSRTSTIHLSTPGMETVTDSFTATQLPTSPLSGMITAINSSPVLTISADIVMVNSVATDNVVSKGNGSKLSVSDMISASTPAADSSHSNKMTTFQELHKTRQLDHHPVSLLLTQTVKFQSPSGSAVGPDMFETHNVLSSYRGMPVAQSSVDTLSNASDAIAQPTTSGSELIETSSSDDFSTFLQNGVPMTTGQSLETEHVSIYLTSHLKPNRNVSQSESAIKELSADSSIISNLLCDTHTATPMLTVHGALSYVLQSIHSRKPGSEIHTFSSVHPAITRTRLTQSIITSPILASTINTFVHSSSIMHKSSSITVSSTRPLSELPVVTKTRTDDTRTTRTSEHTYGNSISRYKSSPVSSSLAGSFNIVSLLRRFPELTNTLSGPPLSSFISGLRFAGESLILTATPAYNTFVEQKEAHSGYHALASTDAQTNTYVTNTHESTSEVAQHTLIVDSSLSFDSATRLEITPSESRTSNVDLYQTALTGFYSNYSHSTWHSLHTLSPKLLQMQSLATSMHIQTPAFYSIGTLLPKTISNEDSTFSSQLSGSESLLASFNSITTSIHNHISESSSAEWSSSVVTELSESPFMQSEQFSPFINSDLDERYQVHKTFYSPPEYELSHATSTSFARIQTSSSSSPPHDPGMFSPSVFSYLTAGAVVTPLTPTPSVLQTSLTNVYSSEISTFTTTLSKDVSLTFSDSDDLPSELSQILPASSMQSRVSPIYISDVILPTRALTQQDSTALPTSPVAVPVALLPSLYSKSSETLKGTGTIALSMSNFSTSTTNPSRGARPSLPTVDYASVLSSSIESHISSVNSDDVKSPTILFTQHDSITRLSKFRPPSSVSNVLLTFHTKSSKTLQNQGTFALLLSNSSASTIKLPITPQPFSLTSATAANRADFIQSQEHSISSITPTKAEFFPSNSAAETIQPSYRSVLSPEHKHVDATSLPMFNSLARTRELQSRNAQTTPPLFMSATSYVSASSASSFQKTSMETFNSVTVLNTSTPRPESETENRLTIGVVAGITSGVVVLVVVIIVTSVVVLRQRRASSQTGEGMAAYL